MTLANCKTCDGSGVLVHDRGLDESRSFCPECQPDENEPTWYELEINRLKAVIESLKEDKKKLVAEIFELSLENTATLEYYTENNDLNS